MAVVHAKKVSNVKNASLDIIIVGASGGIGQYLVHALSNKNRIIGTYYSASSSDLIEGAEYHKVNVANSEEVNNFINSIGPSLSIPVLIYAVGISPNNVTAKIIDEDWNNTIAVNLSGAMYCSRAILPWMKKVKYGRLIYISSVLSRIAVNGTLAYSVTKAGLNSMAKVIASENALNGITSNSVALGYFDVGIISAVPGDYLNKHVLPQIPLQRLGNPAKIIKREIQMNERAEWVNWPDFLNK